MRLVHSRADKFTEQVRGKRNLYCFGAGAGFFDFLQKFSNYGLESDIKCIIDNSKEKQGTEILCAGRKIPVISAQEMLLKIGPEAVILITTMRYAEIIEQLNKYDRLEKIECFLYNFLWIEQLDYERERIAVPDKLSTGSKVCIPKLIHYCWFGKKKLPEQNRIWIESWKKYCPDYQIMEWNEQNYDISQNLYMRQAYEKGKWAFVSDYVRLDLVWKYGGIYLDTDVELIKNIDELLKNEAFCGFESKNYINFGLGFGAVKHHPLIKKLKDDYMGRRFILEDGRLNETTCPVYQTKLLEQYGLKKNGKFQIMEGIVVYPERVLCPMSPYSFRIMKNLERSYSIHHFSGSWIQNDGRKAAVLWS